MAHRMIGTNVALAIGFAMALALTVPGVAQQPPPVDNPTKEAPLRFTAFAVSMPQGAAWTVEIVIERWSTDKERAALIDLLAGASFKSHGQDKLLRALQDVKPRVGYIRTPNSLGWDLHYGQEPVRLTTITEHRKK